MNDHFGVPGIGGSLGQCSLCGENFLADILLGNSVATLESPTVRQTLYAHHECARKYASENLDVLRLPTKSPLRIAFERASK